VKALSIKQPWADQIAQGSKKIEYRSWNTKFKGDFVVVASKSPSIEGLPTGCTICLAELYDVTGQPGDYQWHLRNIRPLPPVPIQGRLRFFEIDL